MVHDKQHDAVQRISICLSGFAFSVSTSSSSSLSFYYLVLGCSIALSLCSYVGVHWILMCRYKAQDQKLSHFTCFSYLIRFVIVFLFFIFLSTESSYSRSLQFSWIQRSRGVEMESKEASESSQIHMYGICAVNMVC